jgi:glycosyltransferase involved in cell wall biosynthesis
VLPRENNGRARVAHVSVIHPPADARIFEKQCRTLVEQGYEVHFLVGGGPREPQRGVRFSALSPEWRRPRLRGQWSPQYRALRQALALRARLYHLHDPHLIPLGLLLKLRGARVIYDVHEDYCGHARTKLAARPIRGRIKSGVWRGLENAARRTFDGFVGSDEEIAERFPADRTAVVHNFPRTDVFLDESGPAYAERSSTVLYLGVQRVDRGFWEAVQGMTLVPERLDCRLRLVGRVHPQELVEQARDHPGWRCVDYVPWQPREVAVRELSLARVGLVAFHPMPNQTNGIRCNKLFEYMAAGLPVIASDAPGWRGIVEDAGCGIAVDPGDPREIATAIEYLLTHPEEAEEMGRRGRAAVEAQFNWNADSSRVRGLYERVGVPAHP